MKNALIIVLSLFSSSLFGESSRVPDEFESTGGHSLGFSNAGVAAAGGLSAIKLNPAMLPLEKQYRLSAGYHWPTLGREYYQAGVVDSTTSKIAAGVIHTASQDEFSSLDQSSDGTDEQKYNSLFDSPIKSRTTIAIGMPLEKFSLGVSGQLTEGWDDVNPRKEKFKGTTFGLGIAGLITPDLRFGASAENLGNERIRYYAPRIYRAGLAYSMYGGLITAHLDYRDRQRVPQEYATLNTSLSLVATAMDTEEKESEKMVTGSFSVGIQNILKLLGSYGRNVSGEDRQTASGGIAIIQNHFALSYTMSKPYLRNPEIHQSLNVGMNINL